VKLIQALKQIKNLQRKADDILSKIKTHSAYSSHERPVYGDSQETQTKQVNEWIQSRTDIAKEILRLRIAIQKTNIAVPVSIEIDGKTITKSIAEWIHRRRDLANMDLQTWAALTDRNLKQGKLKDSQGIVYDIGIVRCYVPEQRDIKMEIYRSEPTIIDSTLEIVNSVTDLIEE